MEKQWADSNVSAVVRREMKRGNKDGQMARRACKPVGYHINIKCYLEYGVVGTSWSVCTTSKLMAGTHE